MIYNILLPFPHLTYTPSWSLIIKVNELLYILFKILFYMIVLILSSTLTCHFLRYLLISPTRKLWCIMNGRKLLIIKRDTLLTHGTWKHVLARTWLISLAHWEKYSVKHWPDSTMDKYKTSFEGFHSKIYGPSKNLLLIALPILVLSFL